MFDFEGNILLKYAFIFANIFKGIAFISISYTLINVWRRKKNIMKSWVILLFALFLLLTACSRFIDISLLFYPFYSLYVLFLFLSGIAALATAIVLPSTIRQRLRLLTPDEYHKLNNDIQAEMRKKEVILAEHRNMIVNLELQVRNLEKMRDRGVWLHEQQNILDSLKRLLRNGDNGT